MSGPAPLKLPKPLLYTLHLSHVSALKAKMSTMG